MRRLILLSIALGLTSALRYDYGDGSYYVGEVDQQGRPSGQGVMYDTAGNIRKEDKSLNYP